MSCSTPSGTILGEVSVDSMNNTEKIALHKHHLKIQASKDSKKRNNNIIRLISNGINLVTCASKLKVVRGIPGEPI